MNQENQMIEIDVLSLLKTIWKRKFLIILTALLTGILALGYSVFIAKPAYKSTTRIYVVNRQQGENPTLTNQDLQAGSYLVKDYKEIILSQDVLASVISELKLSGSPSDLASKVTVKLLLRRSSLLPRYPTLQRWKKQKHQKHRLLQTSVAILLLECLRVVS